MSQTPEEIQLCNRTLMKTRCSCCHICRTSLKNYPRDVMACTTCNAVVCRTCFRKRMNESWEDAQTRKDTWSCPICERTCNCNRCLRFANYTTEAPVFSGARTSSNTIVGPTPRENLPPSLPPPGVVWKYGVPPPDIDPFAMSPEELAKTPQRKPREPSLNKSTKSKSKKRSRSKPKPSSSLAAPTVVGKRPRSSSFSSPSPVPTSSAYFSPAPTFASLLNPYDSDHSSSEDESDDEEFVVPTHEQNKAIKHYNARLRELNERLKLHVKAEKEASSSIESTVQDDEQSKQQQQQTLEDSITKAYWSGYQSALQNSSAATVAIKPFSFVTPQIPRPLPTASTSAGKMSPQEEALIGELLYKIGPDFKEISRRLNGRRSPDEIAKYYRSQISAAASSAATALATTSSTSAGKMNPSRPKRARLDPDSLTWKCCHVCFEEGRMTTNLRSGSSTNLRISAYLLRESSDADIRQSVSSTLKEMIRCDSCDRGFHLSCIDPLRTVSTDSPFYCTDCTSSAFSITDSTPVTPEGFPLLDLDSAKHTVIAGSSEEFFLNN